MVTTTRFAPSPTGYLHFGNARTALLSYLYSKSNNGKFILRIDDTDLERSKKEYEDSIKKDLAWLGLTYDETFNQSSKIAVYQEYAKKLMADGRLYPCYETPEELEYKKKLKLAQGKPPIYDRAMLDLTEAQKQKYEQEGRKPHYRFKMEHKDIAWHDLCKGEVKYHGSNIGDPVLIKDNGVFLYSLCSVIDDIESNITHIIRGEDHMSNTAVHVQLFECLGAKSPVFAHMSLISILGGGEFSKRTGSLSLRDFQKQGIHPLAILNYLFMLGKPEEDKVYLSLDEILKDFNIASYSKSTVKFDFNKLNQLNVLVLQKLSFVEVEPYLQVVGITRVNQAIWDLYKYNINNLLEIQNYYAVLYGDIKAENLSEINANVVAMALTNLPKEFNEIKDVETWLDNIKNTAIANKIEIKNKDIFTTLRLAISGSHDGPLFKNLVLAINADIIKKRLQAVDTK